MSAHRVSAGYGFYLGAACAAGALLSSVWAVGLRPGAQEMSRFVEPVTLTGAQWGFTRAAMRRAYSGDHRRRSRRWGAVVHQRTVARRPRRLGVSRMAAMQAADEGVTYVIRRRSDGVVVGSSSLFHVDAANRRLEIGHTWYSAAARAHRGQHRDETGDALPTRSTNSVASLWSSARTSSIRSAGRPSNGSAPSSTACCAATNCWPDGSRRDTVVYSILDIEWPAVRNNLNARLATH